MAYVSSQAFLLCPLSSHLHISLLGAAIKGTTSFSSQEKELNTTPFH
jgi:hypothetical protein